MATEIHSAKMSQVTETETAVLEPEMVQTPTEDFLDGSIAADPESFNVCISCD